MSTVYLLLFFFCLIVISTVQACGRRCCNEYYYTSDAGRAEIIESRVIKQSDHSPAPGADCGRGVYLTNEEPNHYNRTKSELAALVYGSKWVEALEEGKLDHAFGFNLRYSKLDVCNKSGIYLLVYRRDINIDALDEYSVIKNEATSCRADRVVTMVGLAFCGTARFYL